MGEHDILMLGSSSRWMVSFISCLLHHLWSGPGTQCTGNWMQPTANLVMVARRKKFLFCTISVKWPTASHYTKLYKAHAVGSSTHFVTSPGDGTTSWGSYSSEDFHCNMHDFKVIKIKKKNYTKLVHKSGCNVQGHVQTAFRYQQMRSSIGAGHNIFISARARACAHTHTHTQKRTNL